MSKKILKAVISLILAFVLTVSMFPAVVVQAADAVIKVLVEPTLLFYRVYPFGSGVAVVYDHYDRAAVVDRTGTEVIPFGTYDSYGFWDRFYDGIAVIFNGGFGAIDTTGKIVVPFGEYDWINRFSEGFATVGKDGQSGLIDTGGNLVVPLGEYVPPPSAPIGIPPGEYDWIVRISDGFATVVKGGKYGLVDMTGTYIIPPGEYDDIVGFSEGLAWVKKNDMYGIVQDANYVEYIYDTVDPGESMKLPLHLLAGVTDQASAIAAIQEAASGMTGEQKQSATGIDLVTLFAEEAIAQAASTAVSGNSVTIDQASVNALQAKADSTKTAAEQTLAAGGIDTQREISTTVKFRVDAKTVTVTIDPSAKNATADNVRIETPGFAVTFSAEAIAQNAADTAFVITIAESAANKYTIEYNQPVNEHIKVALPPISGDPTYQAIIDASGNAIGGKHNPVTGMLEAKTNPSQKLEVKENKKDFSDISGKSAEMQKAINVLASKGIVNGKSATTFAPDSPITRAEIAQLIVKTLSKLDMNADGDFADVKKTDWYFGACGSAKRHGIMNGTSATTFAPNVNIPKDQIVCVAARVLRREMQYKSPTNTSVGEVLKVYKDANSLADWSRTDIALATHANLVVRRSDGEFRPNTTMTRGDAAIVLYRMFLKLW